MKALIKKIDRFISKTEKFILMSGILLIAVNSIANAVGRYFLSSSIYFTEELNSFLILIVTFYGLGYVTRTGRHIRMSAVYDTLPNRMKKILMIIMAAVTCILMFLLAYYAYEYVLKTARRGRVSPALSIPVYITYIWVVAGFITTGLQYFFTVIRNLNLNSETVYLSYTKADVYEEVYPESAESLIIPSAQRGQA